MTSGGMSLRDYFAAKAMAALLSNVNASYDIKIDAMKIVKPFDREIAENAYGFADAMLKEREK